MSFTIKDQPKGLCHGCRKSHITKDDRGESLTTCIANSSQPRVIRRPIVECDRHEEMGTISNWEAEKIAWILEVKKGQVIGFKPPEKSHP